MYVHMYICTQGSFCVDQAIFRFTESACLNLLTPGIKGVTIMPDYFVFKDLFMSMCIQLSFMLVPMEVRREDRISGVGDSAGCVMNSAGD